MKFTRPLIIIVACLALGGAALWQFVLKEQMAFADVATAYAAKQICSCRFVAERSIDSCSRDFTQDISQLDISEVEDLGAPGVKASALGLISATAVHQPGFGCVLRP
ncbi:MAG: hypothetical protein AAFY34_15740 [Pseudomonadota bacterium]